jgi:tetratricopeptide (TPR) repeat protein
MWAFTLVWCGISGPMFYVWAFQAGEILAGTVAGFFLLIGLVVFYGTARMTLEYWKFGAMRVVLTDIPRVGKSVAASLAVPERAVVAGHIETELACIRVTYARGSKGSTSSKSEDAWSEKHRIPVQRTGKAATAFMQIDVPAALHCTDIPEGQDAAIDFGRAYYKWELRIGADVPGIDLQRSFEVQVLPPASGAADAPHVAASGVGRRTASPVSFVNPVIVVGGGTPGSPVARARLIKALALAGLIGGGIAAVVVFFSEFAPLDSPSESASSSDEGDLRHPRAAGAADLQAGPEATEFVDLQARDALGPLRPAVIAQAMGRNEDAARLFQEALVAAERDHGATSPLAALVHHRISVMYLRQRRHVEQEQALLRALAILERYPASEVKRTLAKAGEMLDVEMVAADLGYAYWEQRRYDQAYTWYQRAHDMAQDLDVSEDSRNRRLALSSAGLMASACTQGKWDIADRAMAELKERRQKVEPGLGKWLDYWISTGEPRLHARRC